MPQKQKDADLHDRIAKLEAAVRLEVSLEKVRTASMAMQKTDELANVVTIVAQQFRELGIDHIMVYVGIYIYSLEDKYVDQWFSPIEGIRDEPFYIQLPSESWEDTTIKEWRSGKEMGFLSVHGTEAIMEYSKAVDAMANWNLFERMAKKLRIEVFEQTEANHKYGNLSIVQNRKATPSEKDILKRFAKVFEQTYTRFLDLQKAEGQAREAQIEAALERVRASSLAMHHSSDLTKSAGVLFEQIQLLGAKTLSTGFVLCDVNNPIDEQWMYAGEASGIVTQYIPHKQEPIHNNMYEAWHSGIPMMTQRVEGDVMENMLKFLISQESVRSNLEKMAQAGVDFPDTQVLHSVNFNQGYLLIVTEQEYNEQDILIRFANVFEQCYTRFLDLQKAEAQTREAQIEAALERIRAVSMAMHQSDELQSVIIEIFNQLRAMGIQMDVSFIEVFDDTQDTDIWVANPLHDYSQQVHIPYFKNPILDRVLEARKNGEPFITDHYTKGIKNRFYRQAFKKSDLGNIPPKAQENILNQKGFARSIALTEDVAIAMLNWDANPYSDEANTILRRFTKAFQRSYTRFLDLQKAEAQAREAQIEAALERVRSRSIAMHHSHELAEAAELLYEEFYKLGVTPFACGYVINDEENDRWNVWMTDSGQESFNQFWTLPYNADRHLLSRYQSWKNKQPFHQNVLEGKANYRHHKVIAKYAPWKEATLDDLPPKLVLSSANFKHGHLLIIYNEVLSLEIKDVLIRFAKVFEQTYTRFLDLQKAEAQAREAQIEAALERVRAASMAIHQSSELSSIIFSLYHEMSKLDVALDRCMLLIVNPDTEDITWWFAGREGMLRENGFLIKNNKYPSHKAYIQGWREKKKKWRYFFGGEEKKKWDNYAFSKTSWAVLPAHVKKDMSAVKEVYLSISSENFGCLTAGTLEPLSEMHQDLLMRFSQVFDQAYTRFLDIRKAEAQAREAQIEAALERVRAASMAMHKSEELPSVALSFFNQIDQLGIPINAASINLVNESTESYQLYFANKHEVGITSELLIKDFWFAQESFRQLKEGKKEFTVVCEGDKLKAQIDFVKKEISLERGLLLEKAKLTKSYIRTVQFYELSHIIFSSISPLSKEILLVLRRMTKAFGRSYTRFLDLQKAEAQTREAQVEAALERVRSRSMAMHKSEDLKEVVSVLFDGLNKLKIALTSGAAVAINIYLPGHDKMNVYVCGDSDQGLVINNFVHPYSNDRVTKDLFNRRKEQKEVFIGKYSKEEKDTFYQFLFENTELGEIPNEVKNQLLRAKSLIMTSVSTEYFMINVMDLAGKGLSKNEAYILKRFSSVFNQAFIRFLDLQKAEWQKTEIEKVFNENQRLLHSILPEPIAEKIRKGEKTVVKRFDSVSILFADIVGFTVLSEKLSPQKVVDILNGLFSIFDDLTDHYQLEKIKTIGDAYMVASGVPQKKKNHAPALFAFAKDMLSSLQEYNESNDLDLKIRIGISSGPVVAGVIGKKKFAYDLWGDTVNTAARMEAYGRQDCIQISPSTRSLLKKKENFEKIPNVDVKGKGKMDVYLWEAD